MVTREQLEDTWFLLCMNEHPEMIMTRLGYGRTTYFGILAILKNKGLENPSFDAIDLLHEEIK